jgi:hypothetical protein
MGIAVRHHATGGTFARARGNVSTTFCASAVPNTIGLTRPFRTARSVAVIEIGLQRGDVAMAAPPERRAAEPITQDLVAALADAELSDMQPWLLDKPVERASRQAPLR